MSDRVRNLIAQLKTTPNSLDIKSMISEMICTYLPQEVDIVQELILELQLCSLSLSGKGIKQIPDALQFMDTLQTLDLSNNSIETVPEWISKLKRLQSLDLSSNNLSNITSIFELGLLTKLDVSNNQITNVDGISKLASLKECYFDRNELTSFPMELAKVSVEILDLGCNQITLILELNGFKQLVDLRLGNNSISQLPESIGTLESLEILDINDNRLTSVPRSILNLNLTQIQYQGNHGLVLDDDVFEFMESL